jgi:hypothetical protein
LGTGALLGPAAPYPSVERAARVLDRARRTVLLGAMRARPLAAIVRCRDARVLTRSLVGVGLAFAGAIFFPGALFVLSPIVLGVPHVGADFRYLVKRQDVARRAAALLYGGCAALLALRAAELLAPGAIPYARVELSAAAAWIATAALVAAGNPETRLRATGISLVAAGLLLLAWPRPELSRIVFAHAHNAVAIALWLGLFFRGRRATLAPLVLIALALALILRGSTLALVARFGGYDALGSNVFFAADQLAPHVAGALGPAIVLSYVFLQSLHYMAWLAWIPDSVTPAQGTLTFQMTARGLWRDFGGPWLALLALSTLAVMVGALFGAGRARGVYLSLAAFHGYFELAAAAYLVTRSAKRAPAPAWSASSISG